MPEHAPGSAREVVLSSAPGLLAGYARSLLPRRPLADALPEVTLRLAQVVPQADDVRRYAEVVGAPVGDELPLFYPHLAAFTLQLRLMSDPTFPLSPLGMVHTANEVVTTRAMQVGRPFDLAVRACRLRPHRRGRLVDLLSVARQDGEEVWVETSTYLARGRSEPEPEQAYPRDSTGPTDDCVRLHRSACWRLDAGLGRRYGAVSGDRNPIHTSAVGARALGFPRALVHGMWTAAAMAAALHGRLPEALTCTTTFLRPILLPSTVWLHTGLAPGAVRAQVRGDRDDAVHVDLAVTPNR